MLISREEAGGCKGMGHTQKKNPVQRALMDFFLKAQWFI